MIIVKKNVGVDRIIRVILGIILVIIGYILLGSNEILGIILLMAGIVVSITGITGFCPFYALLGISTCPNRNAKA